MTTEKCTATQCSIAAYGVGNGNLDSTVEAVLSVLRDSGLPIHEGAMSTIIEAETSAMFPLLCRAFETASAEGPIVMTLTISNACPTCCSTRRESATSESGGKA